MKTLVAFLLAITYPTFAFAVDCQTVAASCYQTNVEANKNCSGTPQEVMDCQAANKAKRAACIKAGGC